MISLFPFFSQVGLGQCFCSQFLLQHYSLNKKFYAWWHDMFFVFDQFIYLFIYSFIHSFIHSFGGSSTHFYWQEVSSSRVALMPGRGWPQQLKRWLKQTVCHILLQYKPDHGILGDLNRKHAHGSFHPIERQRARSLAANVSLWLCNGNWGIGNLWIVLA